MAQFHGKRVSRRWRTVLTAAEKAGVKFTLNSGRRTMAEQWNLYRLYKAGKGNLAAYPSPNAPHIRVGRAAHAIDVNALDGGETRLQRWLERQGAHPTNPVAGEAWHLELSGRDLRRLASKIKAKKRKPKPQPAPAPAKTGRVRRPHEQFVRIVRNQSARSTPISLIVLHDTEGANLPGITDLRNLGGWFDNPAAQASAHVGVDAEGNSARYVDDGRKAWHCAAKNSPALGIEQVGFASQKDWPDKQLKKVAKYIAYWHQKYGIPIVHSTSHGVCRHSDLGAAGGGHHDPGPNYPLEHVLHLAKFYARNGW